MTDMQPVYCDITELVSNPIRTGIQRVVREVLKHWPGPRPLVLCRFDGEQLVEIPPECSYYLLEPDRVTRSEAVSDLGEKIRQLIVKYPIKIVAQDATIFVPELFFDDIRCRHYMWRIASYPRKIHILFYDFIPWLFPDMLGVQRSYALMWSARLAQRVERAAFISHATFRDWKTRIVRNEYRAGTVLPLGCDALNLKDQKFSRERRNFVALGSIDGRKNQRAIIDAFKLLWAEGVDVCLTLVGRVFESEAAIMDEIEALSQNPRFRHFDRASDEQVIEILSTARATIYASVKEGFGLPPVESLAAGIPCIVCRTIPSTENLTLGLRALSEAAPEAIAKEVLYLSVDENAEKLWTEAALLELPTWKAFGRSVAAWVADN